MADMVNPDSVEAMAENTEGYEDEATVDENYDEVGWPDLQQLEEEEKEAEQGFKHAHVQGGSGHDAGRCGRCNDRAEGLYGERTCGGLAVPALPGTTAHNVSRKPRHQESKGDGGQEQVCFRWRKQQGQRNWQSW